MGIGVGALSNTYGTRYIYGTTASAICAFYCTINIFLSPQFKIRVFFLLFLDISSGDTIDYYYDNEGVVHSYIIELRDEGAYGFQLPPNQIVPTAIETWNGIKALIKAI